MDFSNRSTQPQTVAPSAHAAPATTSAKKGSDKGKWGRISAVALVFAVVVLLLGVMSVVAFGNNSGTDENKYVDSNKLQAVFLQTGQVYFGKIKTLNSKYLVVTNIYYLQTSSSAASTSAAANTSVSLVKLGCELHEPYDQMVINRSQVTFWENLQDNGQVATAVKTFQKANPNGQKCTDQSSSSSTTSNTVQNAGSSSTPATTTTKP